jgi:protein-S-isoprenylcysteine O-methyltransferase Ste14
MTKRPWDEPLTPELSWTLGCLLSAAALIGLVILVLLVALALQPPRWVQVAVGVLLAAGGALFAWLVASALGRTGRPRLRGVSSEPGRGAEDRPGGTSGS